MADYKCTKCGDEVYSKCVHQRSLFRISDSDTMLMWSTVTVKECEVEQARTPDTTLKLWALSIELYKYSDSNDSDAEELFTALKAIVDSGPEMLGTLMCEHDYRVVGNEPCDFGCCKPVENLAS